MPVPKFGSMNCVFLNLNEEGGWAALGRVDIKLADLGN